MFRQFLDIVEANHERAHEKKMERMKRNQKILKTATVVGLCAAAVKVLVPKN
jgi:hypothetical protein